MAARPVPGAADKPQRRVVPGAPPPAPSKASKKGKTSSKAAADVKVPDAKSAALLQKAPANPNQVANGLKVTSQDLAEQAETQAAVAAVEAVQSSAAPVVDAPSTPAQKVISDRINELSAKSKNATITVAIDELKSLLSKVQVAEAGSAPSSSKAGTESEGKARLVLLLQFLHLFNLFHPNPAGPPSFAPQRIMPPALEMSTGQQVAAVAKIYDQLANGPLEGGGGDALQTLASIERGSKDEVLPDVSFDTIRSMILKLTAPPTANADADADAARAAPTGLDGPSKGFVPLGKASSPASPVSFMQASEILDQSGAEPEGGQPSAVPAEGAEESRKGEQAGAGIVMGDAAAMSGKADGTAASAVKEPVNTTVVAEPKLNWAALAEEDDGDLGEAPVWEPLPSSTTSALVTPAPGTPSGGDAAAAPASEAPASGEVANSPRTKKAKSNGGAGRAGNGAGGANGKPTTPKPKPQPKVDEDGFILQESKRTKYLQQKQQQQQRGGGGGGGGGRGGRGGASAGRGGRTNNGARGKGAPAPSTQ
ncbi:hypothetical protein PaG_02165 [Moesziomyces aphidis]|uniref:Uncharacterized protein n=1 Tax=Moesziomyces aphidis TaxID=84754 RepID=W3VQK0_MOEAP|nr:hypothetical protein PaG_02165 [Moesziomyces aphidis]